MITDALYFLPCCCTSFISRAQNRITWSCRYRARGRRLVEKEKRKQTHSSTHPYTQIHMHKEKKKDNICMLDWSDRIFSLLLPGFSLKMHDPAVACSSRGGDPMLTSLLELIRYTHKRHHWHYGLLQNLSIYALVGSKFAASRCIMYRYTSKIIFGFFRHLQYASVG